MTDDFLPKGYKVPQSGGNYMKFKGGENRFRILANPVLGYEAWKTQEDGTKKPVRITLQESFNIEDIDDPEEIKHFWAMPVWNYTDKKVQVLEITQKSIQRTISGLINDKEWGSPVNYDLSVIRTGEKLSTEYQVIPAPPKPLDAEIKEAFEKADIDLDSLFEGSDPFKKNIADEAEAIFKDSSGIK